jgi:hypothetical protein
VHNGAKQLRGLTHASWLAVPERRTNQREEGVMGSENFIFRQLTRTPAPSALRSWQPVVLEGTIMLRKSQWQVNGEPTTCKSCNQPFPVRENRTEAYHVREAGYFCDAACAQARLEAERAKAKRRRAA